MTRRKDGPSPVAHAGSGVRIGVLRLKKRPDFVAAAKGRRQHQKAFVLQARERESAPGETEGPRVGFTVTKKVGKAVVRNRIRRRLREVVRLAGAEPFTPGCDYVVAARREALAAPFDELRGELFRALKKIHRAGTLRPPVAPAGDRKQDL
ncbi:ribonuclease P protein component [Rhodoblastus acidophilus]|uniref:Ribonuclease P protein component n=1 Tax=Candidatus Rhodoblastus alkanivorans TaxID=2954117 RepID=A0ABS9ZAY5_9HYPH|nr:ribonuclease P protein component [Candidatus Rhodoblastus alkanivorans]MCI4677748.1 ribonuclease P protein component [Candidatus Rhodoblastus alkanivorans]MCI4684754.1 ribonuclease P protein component [Candidatus Rhodoblastus alkanivorans]MDI4642077.1 ribonuclease P protein component [Rhodoblastus acidophilus]